MRKLLVVILLLAPMVLSASTIAQAGFLYFNIDNDNHTASLIAVPGTYGAYGGDITIPQKFTYDGAEYSVTAIERNAFWNCVTLKSIVIPEGITSIGDYAFRKCVSLAEIVLPQSLMTIGFGAFYECSQVEELIIPRFVSSIGENFVSQCYNLKHLSVESGNSRYSSFSNSNVIVDTNNNTLLAGCMNSIIPSIVTSIADYAFFGCIHLEQISIPASVLSIGNSAFNECESLQSVEIPSEVKSIGTNAFFGCCNLVSVTLPTSITAISNYTFMNCSSLMTLDVPEGITNIGNCAFSGCVSLKRIKLPSTIASIGEYAFDGCIEVEYVECDAVRVPATRVTAFNAAEAQTADLRVPEESVPDYKNQSPWRYFKRFLNLEGEEVTAIDNVSLEKKANNYSYGVNGIYYSSKHRGITIIRTNDSKYRKVVEK